MSGGLIYHDARRALWNLRAQLLEALEQLKRESYDDEFVPELDAVVAALHPAAIARWCARRGAEATFNLAAIERREYLRALVGWAARVLVDYSEIGCDHAVGICACDLHALIAEARDWEQGFTSVIRIGDVWDRKEGS